MKLRYQLAVLSLTFLAIPWAGCEFLRSNEQSLSLLQEQSLRATGQAIAHGLYNETRLLYPEPKRSTAPFNDRSLQVRRLARLSLFCRETDVASSLYRIEALYPLPRE